MSINSIPSLTIKSPKSDPSLQCSLPLQAWPTICVRIHVPHIVDAAGSQNVIDTDDVLMSEPQQDLDLPQGALAVGLVLEWADLLNGHTDLIHIVKCRAESINERAGHR